MSSARSKTIRNSSFTSYILTFVILQLSMLLCLGGMLFIFENHLRDYCEMDVSHRLENYLKERSSKILVSPTKKEGLQGLTFVRLIRKNEQFLYSEDPDLLLDLNEIVDLDPQSTAIWISLKDTRKKGSWVITSKELENGHLIQAGIQYRHVLRLYERVKNVIAVMTVFSFFLAVGLTYLCRRKSTASIKVAEQSLKQIISQKGGRLLQYNKGDELSPLYSLLNQLISQNRQLIKEMQGSLDNVAHDLRTPMTRLRSVAEYGLQQNTQEKLAEALSDCLEESERVSSMLGIMMSVVEAESGTMQLTKEKIQLYGTIVEVINLYEYVADEKNISLHMQIDPEITIDADKTRITQVWANIVDNGIKYCKNGGYVSITARCDSGGVSVLLEDNGMGISGSEIERIWERLFRGDRSRTQQGLGLGLNYVRAVIEAHGGKVSVTSSLGEGSCFEVRLIRNQGEL